MLKLKQKMDVKRNIYFITMVKVLVERLVCFSNFSFLYVSSRSFVFVLRWQVIITLKKPGSKLEHQGIKIEFIGQIELYYDRGNHHEFVSLLKELARPGELNQHSSCYNFEFVNVEKPFESYTGANVRLRLVRVHRLRLSSSIYLRSTDQHFVFIELVFKL